ncbi:MAG: hypothetical protein Q8P24_11015 [Desulfobacterales bacterium]|nr:hypothetical protein [Desulfobacterales bacterium]
MNRDEAKVVGISSRRINENAALIEKYSRGVGIMCGLCGFALGMVAGLVLAALLML